MMMRLTVFLALCLALYYVIRVCFKGRNWLEGLHSVFGRTGNSNRVKGPFKQPPPVTDELVKDPVCKVYCPKKDALSLIRHGKIYYFCSEECRRKFREQG